MSEDFLTPTTIHADHRYWKQEHSTWRSDIVLWQQEYDAMRTAIEALGRTVERHGAALRKHAVAINDHEAALDLQERVIAEHEIGLERPGPDDGGTDQQQQIMAHLEQRQVHERMKREHHRLVAQLEMLDSILSQS